VKSHLVVLDLYPSLSQPEGDHGNALVLAHRARQYGVDSEVVVIHPGDAVPSAGIVCIGGSQDGDLTVAARLLRDSGDLRRLADAGAVVFGVGAGYVLLSRTFTDSSGDSHEGAGLLDVEMRDAGGLIAGPVVAEASVSLGLGPITGYEYHDRVGVLGPDAEPWLSLDVGQGDAGAVRTAGVRQDRVIGTWMHGPVLPRNPDLADLLLRWAGVAVNPDGCPEDQIAAVVRKQRIAEARR